MDRNLSGLLACPYLIGVALLAEGVDRNKNIARMYGRILPSPSSRRAWIEIILLYKEARCDMVALLAEGVDRNEPIRFKGKEDGSPSSRRAWIEIRMEGHESACDPRRPPRGGRG